MVRCGQHTALFCRAHVHAYRSLQDGEEHAPSGSAACPDTAARIFHRPAVGTHPQADRRQCGPHRGLAGAQAAGSGGDVYHAGRRDHNAFPVRLAHGPAVPFDDGARSCKHVHDDGREECRVFPPLSARDRADERRGGGICQGHTRREDVSADSILVQGLLQRDKGLQRPGKPVRHELPRRADQLPDVHKRGLRAAYPRGAAYSLGRRRGDRAGELYILRAVRPCLRGHDKPHHVHERGDHGGRRGSGKAGRGDE